MPAGTGVDEVLQAGADLGGAQRGQGVAFHLAGALAGEAHHRADLLQRPWGAGVQPEPQDQHLALPLRRRFPDGYRPYGGSQFWSLPREAAAYVSRFAHEETSFVRFFEHVYIPDELFFPTVLLNSSFRDDVLNDNLRHIEWTPSDDGGGPRVWRTEDFAELAGSSKLFARKFDVTVDEGILDLLDRRSLSVG